MGVAKCGFAAEAALINDGNSFSLYGVNAHGKCVLRRALSRAGVVPFFDNLPACVVGMEACASSEFWARQTESLGHTVRRIHPRYGKAYLLGAKNDVNDAAAICEAVQRPHMRFVPHKSLDQMYIQLGKRVDQLSENLNRRMVTGFGPGGRGCRSKLAALATPAVKGVRSMALKVNR